MRNHQTNSSDRLRFFHRFRRGGATAGIVGVTFAATAAIAVFWGVNNLGEDADAKNARLSSEPDWHQVQPISFDITIIATGELDARDQIKVKSQVEGKASIIEIVDEGVTVSEGDPIIKLADDEIRDKIEQQELTVEKALTDELAAKENLAIDTSEANSLLDEAEVKKNLAKLELEKWQNGTVKEKRSELKINIFEAGENLKIAESNAIDAKKLAAEGFISENELKDDNLKFEKAKAAKATAELAAKVYEEFTYPQEKEKFESDLRQAEDAYDRTTRKNKANLAKSTNAYESAVRTRELREEMLTKLKEQLELTTIRAPSDGLIVYASTVGSSRYRRSEPISQGREVIFNETIIILPDTTHMVANLKVNESRLPQVKTGQKVAIRINAIKDTPIEGTVSNISVMADGGGFWNPDVRQYEVRIDLPANINEFVEKYIKDRDKHMDDGEGQNPDQPKRPAGKKGEGPRKQPQQTKVSSPADAGKTQFVAADAGKPDRKAARTGPKPDRIAGIKPGTKTGDGKSGKKPGSRTKSSSQRTTSQAIPVVNVLGNGKGSRLAIKPGMRAAGEIYIGRVENALAVPVHAVYTEGKHRFVYIPSDDNRVKRQQVTVGQASEVYVEITSGLKEGDQVLLRKPNPGEVDEGEVDGDESDQRDKAGKSKTGPARN